MSVAGDVIPPEPPRRPGILTENGEPWHSPFEAQEILVPPKRQVHGERDLTGVGLAFDKLRAAIEQRGGWAPEPEPETPVDMSQAHIEHLKYLQRWVAATANLQQRVDTTQRSIDSYADSGKKVPPELRTQLETQLGRLAEGQERDRIQAERAVLYEGCKCLGLGGTNEKPLVLAHPTKPNEVLYSEPNGPTTWAWICPCPEGQLARNRAVSDLAAMRMRRDANQATLLLGTAQIPVLYEHYDLSTYPDQVIAEKVRRWYIANMEGVPADQKAPKIWLLMHGPNRRGKTGLAIGVIKLALSRGEMAVFRSLKGLLDELRATFDRDNPACHADLLAALIATPLLVIDDLGAENLTNGGWLEETLYGLLNERLNAGKLTIITSNIGWTVRLGPEAHARAIQQRTAPPVTAKDWNSEELIERVGERIWWRLRAGASQLPVLGPVLGLDEPTPIRRRPAPTPADTIEEL